MSKKLHSQESLDRSKFRVVGRRFLGELLPDKKDMNYEKAHLKAYLRGESVFSYGSFYDKDGQRHTAQHAVKQEILVEKITRIPS